MRQARWMLVVAIGVGLVTATTADEPEKPARGTMLGMGRLVKDGRTVFYEFVRIETRDADLVMIVSVSGKGGVAFRLTKVDEKLAVFEGGVRCPSSAF